MKYHLTTLIILLVFGTLVSLSNIKIAEVNITVLEVHITYIGLEKYHRVIYNEKSFSSNINRHIDFKSFLGVDNFINEVANKDLSRWRAQ